MTELLFVLSNGLPSREDDYKNWYMTRHLPDMKQVPGVSDGQLYALSGAAEGARWAFAAEYSLAEPVAIVLGNIFARAGSDAMPLTDTIDGDSVLMLGATSKGSRVLAEGVTQQADSVLYVALSNPVEGEDAAFNQWYDERHIPDVLAVPGMIAAQRFTLAPETAGKVSPWRYMARYEIAASRTNAVMAEVMKRAGTDAMPISPALSRDAYGGVFMPAA